MAEAFIEKDDFANANRVLNLMTNQLDSNTTRRRTTDIRQQAADQQANAYLRGRMLARQGKVLEARPFLKQAANLDLDNSDLGVSALLLLGEGYMQSGIFDVAADCYSQASLERPNNREYWRLAADAWLKAGQSEQAIEYLKKLSVYPDKQRPEIQAENWLNLFFALRSNQRSKSQPGDNREATRALEKAVAARDAATPEIAWRVELVETVTQFEETEGMSAEENQAKLDQLADRMPETPEGVRMMTTAYLQIGDQAGADALQAKYAAIASPSVGGDTDSPSTPDVLAEAQQLIRDRKAEQAAQRLEQSIEGVTGEQKTGLQLALVATEFLTHNNPKQSIDRLAEFWIPISKEWQAKQEKLRGDQLAPAEEAQQKQADQQWLRQRLPILKRIADLSVVYADQIELQPQSWETDLPLIEGDDGYWSLYLQAKRDLKQAAELGQEQAGEKQRLLQKATVKQQSLERLRPLWPPTYLLAGDIAAAYPDRLSQAIAGYQRAVDLGERRPEQVLKLVYVLNRDKQFDRAKEYLPMIGRLQGTDIGFALSYDILMKSENPKQAEQLARAKMNNSPADDMLPVLGLATVLMSRNEPDADQEAEQLLKRAAKSNQDRYRGKSVGAAVQPVLATGKQDQGDRNDGPAAGEGPVYRGPKQVC